MAALLIEILCRRSPPDIPAVMRAVAALLVAATVAGAFVAPAPRPRAASIARRAQDKQADEPEDTDERKGKITMDGLRDLVALGLGAPNLGTFKGVDEETGALKFELDENRFITKDGKEYGSFDNSKGTYFESGEVDESADFMGGLMKFFGGGDKKKE